MKGFSAVAVALLTLLPLAGLAASNAPPAPKPKPAEPSGTRTAANTPPAAAKGPKSKGAEPAAITTQPAPAPAKGELPAAKREQWLNAVRHATGGRYEDAKAFARAAKLPGAEKLVDYLYFLRRESGASFADIIAFLDQNPDWPSRELMTRRAEEALRLEPDHNVVLNWFSHRKPVAADGMARLAEALFATGREAEAVPWLKLAWASTTLSESAESGIVQSYLPYLDHADHLARATNLLSEGDRASAKRVLPYLNNDGKRLVQARIALAERANNAEALASALPPELQRDPGLALDRARFLRRSDNDEQALAALNMAPPPDAAAWQYWNERQYHSRRLLAAGQIKEAYRTAAEHRLSVPSVANEAEWLAGWIALRFMNQPETAAEHFRRVVETVKLPISVARGAYWSGRAQEALGNHSGARIWYEAAAQHGATFYGQLAQARIDARRPLVLAPEPRPTADDYAQFEKKELVRATRLLAEGGPNARDYVRVFILRLADQASTPVEHELVASLADRIGRVDLGVMSAKRSQRNGAILLTRLYPMVDVARFGDQPERGLVLATARQESEFNADAVSPAGARGLLQLMPATAKEVAKELRLPYSPERLTRDPAYNTTLGSRYLQRMIDSFDGSYLLALCAYNAGRSRTLSWMSQWGDPRSPEVDVVDWIELIPFNETRNYVQRVLEGLMVYRQRFAPGQAVLRRMDQDLRGQAAGNG